MHNGVTSTLLFLVKCIDLVLSALRVTPKSSANWSNDSRSCPEESAAKTQYQHESLANSFIWSTSIMSFTNSKKRKVPKMDPWGTPAFTVSN